MAPASSRIPLVVFSGWALVVVIALVAIPNGDTRRFATFLHMNTWELFFRGCPSCSPHMTPRCSQNPRIDSPSSPRMPVRRGGPRDTVFQRHAVNNTVMVVQLNTGFVELGLNLLASLKNASNGTNELTKRVVVWAMTPKTAEALKAAQADMGFGIYVESDPHPVMHLPPSDALEPGGTVSYFDMMRSRARFFLHIVRDLGMGLFFVDGDIVFLKDPWPHVVSGNGLGLPGISIAQPQHADPYASVEPDIVYSADAGGSFREMALPFQNFYAIVPRVCGGLFYARPTTNAVRIYTDLERAIWASDSGNDQWTMDELLSDGRDVLLTGPLTGGLCRRHAPCHVSNTTLRVRILDQRTFQNGMMLRSTFGQAVDIANSPAVSLHVNRWDINKTFTMKTMGIWFIP